MKNLSYLLIILIVFSSCRTVKKSWLKENYKNNQQLEQFGKLLAFKIEKKTAKTTEKQLDEFSSLKTKAAEKKTETTSNNLESNTNLKATITAEEGRVKSFTANGLQVTSDGANITVYSSKKNTVSKQIIKENQKEIEALNTVIKSQSEKIASLENTHTSLTQQFANYKSSQVTELKSMSKDVTLKNLPFALWILLLVFGAFIYFFRR